MTEKPADAIDVDGQQAATAVDDDAPQNYYHAAEPSRRLEIVSAVVSLLMCGGLYFITQQIHEATVQTEAAGARFWPTLLAIFGAILALALIIFAIVGRPLDRSDMETATRSGWIMLIAAVAVTLAFILLWPHLDFRLLCLGYLVVVLALFGVRSWKALILFPVGVTALIYILFHMLLRVPL